MPTTSCCNLPSVNKFHVIIIGAGPTGLQAALTFGRALKRTLVIDNGRPRNSVVDQMHNFLGHDGQNPVKFRRGQRKTIANSYCEFVRFVDDEALVVTGSNGEFIVRTNSGANYSAMRILLAIGVRENIPEFLSQYSESYCKCIFQCPYCHGIELRGKKLAIISSSTMEHVIMFKCWSSDIIYFTNGVKPDWLDDKARDRLGKLGILIEEETIVGLGMVDEDGPTLKEIVFESGKRVQRDIIYHKFQIVQQKLVDDLKLNLEKDGRVSITHPSSETSVQGVYAAGDMASEFHQIAIGVGMGCQAASAIVMDLTLNEHTC